MTIRENASTSEAVREEHQVQAPEAPSGSNNAVPVREYQGEAAEQAPAETVQAPAPIAPVRQQQPVREQTPPQAQQQQQTPMSVAPLSPEAVTEAVRPQPLQPQVSAQQQTAQPTASGYEQPQRESAAPVGSEYGFRLATPSVLMDRQQEVVTQAINQAEINAAENRTDTRQDNWTENEPVEEPTSPNSNVQSDPNPMRKGPAFPKSKPKLTHWFSSLRTRKAEEKARKRAPKEAISQKFWRGSGIYGQITGDPSLSLDRIALGWDVVEELINLPDSVFVSYISEELGIDPSEITSASSIADLVNAAKIPVGVFKTPDLEPESACQMYLAISVDSGISMHPMSAKKFNADFDGDAVTVSFNKDAIKHLPDPTGFIVNLANELTYDMAFFPFYWKRGGIENPKHREGAREAIVATVFYDDTVQDEHVDSLVDKIVDVYFEHDEESMRSFVKALSKVLTRKSGALDTDGINRILSRTYTTLRSLQLVQAGDGAEHVLIEDLPPAMSYNDRKLYEFAEDVYNEIDVRAQGVMNFQDLKVKLCEYLGEPEGTNPSFRFTANVAKLFVNIDTRIQIGSEVNVDLEDLLQGLLIYIESAKISNEVYLSENAKAAKETLVEIIVSSVGTPRDYPSFAAFLDRFLKVYRQNAAIMNAADISVMTDFKLRRGESGVYEIGNANPTLKEVALALVDVYGNLGVAEVFFDVKYKPIDDVALDNDRSERAIWTERGALYVHAVYGSMSLRQLSHDSRMPASGKELETIARKSVYSANGAMSPDISRDMIMTIVNMRTSGANHFNTKLFGKDGKTPEETRNNYKQTHMYKLWQVLKSIDRQIGRSGDSLDWGTWINDMLQLLNMSNPDVFSYFGMDHPKGFFKSKYGSAMMAVARTTSDPKEISERLGSIRIAMMVDYRTGKIAAKAKKIDDLADSPNFSEKKLEKLYNDRRAEENILASSSMVWRGIVMEMRADAEHRMFDRLKSGENVMGLNFLNYGGWTSGRLDGYTSIVDVLMDISLPKSEKCDIVSDVVRSVCMNPYFASFEVPVQIERDSSSAYSSLPPTSVGVMQDVNEFDESFDKFHKKSFRAMSEQVEDAYDKFGDKTGMLTAALSFYAGHPEFFVEVDEMSFADALCSTLDKVYAQSEKGKQHPWTNAIYSIMSFARNQGFFSDVYRTDDRAIGLVPMESLSAYDIVKILADGDYSMHVYNSSGQYALLNRDILVGKDNASEQDIWDFLLANPRIGACLRVHRACAMADNDGKGFMGADSSISEFISRATGLPAFGGPSLAKVAEREDRYRLYDMPTYAALVAICVPTGGRSSRTMRIDYNKVDEALRNDLSFAARMGIGANELLETLHLTEPEIVDAGVEEKAAAEMYSLIVKSVEEMLEMLGENGLFRNAEPSGYEYSPPDLAACFNYYDVRQEFSGSKTAVSTGVEGTETWKLAAFISALRPKDRYGDLKSLADVDDVTYDELVERFGDQLASYQRVDEDGNLETVVKPLKEFTEEELSDNGEIVFEAPEGFTVPDKTLDSHGHQVSSVCAYLIVKRDHGAEKFNLKAKRSGLDKFNSVTKHGKYFSEEEISGFSFQTDNYADLKGAINDIYDPNDPSSLFRAKMLIAQRLVEANRICGYDEMTLANCMSLADLMVVVNEDAGELNLRSISMIAKAIKSHVTYDLIDNGNAEDLSKVAAEAAANAGAETIDIYDVLASIRVATPMTGSPSLLRPRQSSWSRNYDLMNKITENLGDDFVMPTKTQVKEKSRRFVTDKTAPIADLADHAGYNLLGYENSFEMVPGPSTLWFVNENTDNLIDVLRNAWRLGVTVLVPNGMIGTNPDIQKFTKDAFPAPGSVWGIGGHSILPMFYMRLDGSEAFPAPPKFGVYRAPADNWVWSFEDPLNMYSLGDAEVQLFTSLVERTNINWGETTTMLMSNMFQSVYEAYPDASFIVRYATTQEIERILNPALPTAVDIGVAREGRDIRQHWKVVMQAIDKYILDKPKLDDYGWRKEAKPGDIIGWMALDVRRPGSTTLSHVYAPVIPFDLKGTNDVSRESQPSRFEITRRNLETDTIPTHTALSIDWKYTDGIEGHNVKFFEGDVTSNKFYTSTSRAVDGGAMEGTNIPFDACYVPESTVSRRVGDNRRIDTLQSLMVASRTVGYNFAEIDGSFPDDPMLPDETPLKEKLRNGYVTRREWAPFLANPDFRWHSDNELNSWLKREVAKFVENGGCPTDLLCSEFSDEFTDVWWEFKGMFEAKLAYQDGLMKFVHSMLPTMCAESTKDTSEGYTFRCMPNDANDPFNMHCMAVKRYYPNGKGGFFPMWVNAYAKRSFFNFNDFTGAHRINVNGSSDMLDAVSTLALSGRMPKKDTWRAWLRSCMSDIGEAQTPFSIVELDERDMFVSSEEIEDLFESKGEQVAPKHERILGDEFGKVLALTGHRPNIDKRTGESKLWGYDMSDPHYAEVKRRLADYCRKNGIDTIVSGMAQGFDQLGAEVAIEQGLKLVCAVPFEGQESGAGWPVKKQQYYRQMLQKADKVFIISDKPTSKQDAKNKLQIRNEWMVDNADDVFALYDGSKGGTRNCVRYARSKKVHIERLRPEDVSPYVIDEFTGDHGFLSNMYYSELTFRQIPFDSVESAFQAQKLRYLTEKTDLMPIDFSHITGEEARKIGRTLPLDRDAWERDKLEIMRELVFRKFIVSRDPFLQKKLLETGDALLVEGNEWKDTYWGVYNGVGQNNLGKILMEVRDELKRGAGSYGY